MANGRPVRHPRFLVHDRTTVLAEVHRLRFHEHVAARNPRIRHWQQQVE